jgi:hypothetical protein
MSDLADRPVGRIQLATDGNGAYLKAVADAYRGCVDYAMLVKQYESVRPVRRAMSESITLPNAPARSRRRYSASRS